MRIGISALALLAATLVAASADPKIRGPVPEVPIDSPSDDEPTQDVELITEQELADLRATYEPCGPTRAVGLPWRGSLQCAALLPHHDRLWVRTWFLFGTQETMDALHHVAVRLDERNPGGQRLEVFDISRRVGGPSPYHISHQNGRDVDLGYLYRDGYQPEPYGDVPPQMLDAARTWQLIAALIETGDVRRILIDYAHQEVLRSAATRAGVNKLDRYFQYPRGKYQRLGLIRHYPNHLSHMHVRFRCPKGHRTCRG